MIKNFLSTKEWQKWNFEEIFIIIETISNKDKEDRDKDKLFQDLCENHFFRKLIKFYRPSERAFIDIAWKPENFIYAKTGYHLIKLLLKSNYGRKLLSQSISENFFENKLGFLAEIQSLLDQDQKYLKHVKSQLSSSFANPPGLKTTSLGPMMGDQVLLNFDSFNYTMLREFFCWIGLFTQTKHGMDLLTELDILGTLKKFIKSSGSRDHLVRTILFSLNYTFDGPKNFLITCLTTGSAGLRISCLTIIKLLYKAEAPDLLSWIQEPVLKQINSKMDDSVVDQAISTIEIIACDESSLIRMFKDTRIEISPK
jgi:hypothetical protein